MLVAEEILGRLDGAFEERETVETAVLSDEERKRSRVRTTTDAGTEVGLLLGDERLRPGDVVYADDERVVAVAFEEREALVVDLSGIDADPATLAALVELGHAVGNRHRDLAVRDGEVLLPVEEGDRIRDDVEPHLPETATVRREAVDPTLFDAASGGPDHDHPVGDDHDHGHTAEIGHDHDGGGE